MSVKWKGNDVPLQVSEELIKNQGTPDETFKVYIVPHHGPIIPDSYVYPSDPGMPVGRALAVKYTGDTVSNELAFFTQLLQAGDFAAAETAQDNFRVGAQNFSFASATDGIHWSTEARVPQRDPRACTFAYDARGVPTRVGANRSWARIRRSTRRLEVRTPFMRSRAQTLRWPSPWKGLSVRMARIRMSSAASGIAPTGPGRRAGSDAASDPSLERGGERCRWTVARDTRQIRHTRASP